MHTNYEAPCYAVLSNHLPTSSSSLGSNILSCILLSDSLCVLPWIVSYIFPGGSALEKKAHFGTEGKP